MKNWFKLKGKKKTLHHLVPCSFYNQKESVTFDHFLVRERDIIYYVNEYRQGYISICFECLHRWEWFRSGKGEYPKSID